MNEAVFISYSRSDSQFALKLAQDLRAANVSIWVDQLDIPAGEPWDRAVENALQQSKAIIIILSPRAVESRSVMDEVSFALEEKMSVFPVLHEKCKVPFRLRRLQYTDFTSDYSAGLYKLVKALGGVVPTEGAFASRADSSARRLHIIWFTILLICITSMGGIIAKLLDNNGRVETSKRDAIADPTSKEAGKETPQPAPKETEAEPSRPLDQVAIPKPPPALPPVADEIIERRYQFQGPFRISRVGDAISFNLTEGINEPQLARLKVRLESVSFTGYVEEESDEPFGYDHEVLIFPSYSSALPGQINQSDFGIFQRLERDYSPPGRQLQLMVKTDSKRYASSLQPIEWTVDIAEGSTNNGELKFLRDNTLATGSRGVFVQLFLWTLWGGEHFVVFKSIDLTIKFRVLRQPE